MAVAHAAASARPYDITLESKVWGRLLGLAGGNVGSMITRQWNWLEEQKLVRTFRTDRLRTVVLLREDGSDHPYTHPGVSVESRPAEGDYFMLHVGAPRSMLQSVGPFGRANLFLNGCVRFEGFTTISMTTLDDGFPNRESTPAPPRPATVRC